MGKRSGKGGQFERRISKELSLWFSEGKADDWFWRSAMSGGRATVRARQGKTTEGHYGDLAATCPQGSPLLAVLTMEVKRGYSKDSLHSVIDKRDNAAAQSWETWVEQATASAALAGNGYWAIIAKRDRCEPVIAVPEAFLSHLEEVTGEQFGASEMISIVYTDRTWENEGESVFFSVLKLHEFFQIVTPDSIRCIAKELKNASNDTPRG